MFFNHVFGKCQLVILVAVALIPSMVLAKEYHVSVDGCDSNKGSKSKPFRTIQAAADIALPGDVITVHEGVYRERINPPSGGTSDKKRIVYQASKDGKAVIKGSEVIKGWKKVQDDTWKVVIANTFFGDFNPYNDLISGDWFDPRGREHHTGAVYLNGVWLAEATNLEEVLKPVDKTSLWFAQVDDSNTTIWAQFKCVDPNKEFVEINARQTVFYPKKTGVNYITVRGFTMMQAATPWAPPTAEQIGLIGPHWSKGWIIENNSISYSKCTGISLGKYGDEYDNTSQDSAKGYVETINRALKNGWSKDNIGHHIVRNNHIFYCEQAGIVGSLGAIFSTITGNEIHDINSQGLLWGAELGGIKIHGAIDVEISRNYIHRSGVAIWLDWMAQGARVTRNLFDAGYCGMFIEVNHGPLMIDNNLFISPIALLDMSEGTAYVQNLFAGNILFRPNVLPRETPYLKPHSAEIAGMSITKGGDNWFINNIFTNDRKHPDLYNAALERQMSGLEPYNEAVLPMQLAGNVFLNGANPCKGEQNPIIEPEFKTDMKLIEQKDGVYLHVTLDKAWAEKPSRPLVTTKLLGKAEVSDQPYVQPDGSPYRIDTDYFGKKRDAANPFPGPFEHIKQGTQVIKVWPVK